jgi:hypothetical protein
VNSVYIGVGLTIIAALVAALIGPFFVDWSVHRAVFEHEITRLAGFETRILGDIDVRILPNPRLRFADVVIGPVDAPIARVARFDLDLEVAPLIRGEVRIAETRLERPAVDLEIDEAGRLVSSARPVVGMISSAQVDLVEISDGRLSLTDRRSGRRLEASRIAGTGSAASLVGPWRFDGGAQVAGRSLAFRLSAGAPAERALAVRLQGGFADDPATATLDLVVHGDDGRLSATGSLGLDRREPRDGVPAALGSGIFRLDSRFAVDAEAFTTSEATLSLGPEEKAVQLAAEARIALVGDRRFEARLVARQIDLDRLGGRDDRPRVDPAEAVAGIAAGLARGGDGIGTGRLTLDLDGVVLGGGVVQEVAAVVATRPGGLTIERFQARLPGRARLDLAGVVTLAEGGRFDGHAELAAEQPALVAAWWRGRPVSGERFDALTLTGEVSVGTDRLAGENLSLGIGSARMRGGFDWRRGGGLDVAASADRLEFDQLARLGRLIFDGDETSRPPALTLDLDAGTVVVGGISAKTVAVRAKVSDQTLSVDRLTVADFAGARIEGSGRIDRPTTVPDGAIDLTIAAARPEAAVRAIASFVAEPAAVERATGLAALAGPLDVHLRLSGRALDGASSDLAFGVTGKAAGADLAIDGHWLGRTDDPAHATLKIRAGLDGAAPTGALARALGPLAAKGKLAVAVSAEGTAATTGLAVDARATIGAARLATAGRVRVTDAGARIDDGRLALASPDLTGLAVLAGRPILAIERRLPVDLSASVSGPWPRLEVADLAGTIDGTRIRASGRVDLGVRPVAVSGSLDADRLELATLAGLSLGEGASGGGNGHGWSDSALGVPAFAGTADLDLAVTIGRATIGEAAGLDRLGFRLEARENRVRIGGLAAGLAGGRIAGDLAIDRHDRVGTRFEGRMSVDAVPLEEIGWRVGDRPVVSGRVGGEATVVTVGRSAAAMVAGLTGQGRFVGDGLNIVGFGIDAMAATTVASDSGTLSAPGDLARVFLARMAASRTALDHVEVPFAVEAGTVRSGRVIVETPNARITGRVAIDLAAETIDSDWTMEPTGKAAEAVRTAVSKATPSAGVGVRGPLAAPTVRFDTAPFAAYLTLRNFEREIDRVETMQQDILERQRFARERRRLEEIRREQEESRRAQENETARKAQEAEAARRAQEAGEAAKRAQDAADAVKRAREGEAVRRAAPAEAPATPTTPPPLPPPVQIAPAPPVLGSGGRIPAAGETTAPLTILPPAAPPPAAATP